MKVFTPAERVAMILSHDLACTIENLAREARRYVRMPTPQFTSIKDLAVAAVAFAVQLAIEADHDPTKMRALEQEMFDVLDAKDP